MIAALLYPALLIFGFICTLISAIPPTKKILSHYFQSFRDRPKFDPPPKPPTPIKTSAAVDLRSVFATFDKNEDGYITKQELRESLKNMGISAGETDVVDMVERVDSNGDGQIDYDEFCKLFDSISGGGGDGDRGDDYLDGGDGDLRDAFNVFDENKDGLITVEELGLMLSSLGFTEGKKLEDCKEMIRQVDMDGDGMVNFQEFKTMMEAGLARIISIS